MVFFGSRIFALQIYTTSPILGCIASNQNLLKFIVVYILLWLDIFESIL